MYEGELPIKPGTASDPVSDICTSSLVTNPAHLRLMQTYSMHELSTDFSFFSHAFWFSGAGLNIDPVQDWYDKHPRHVPLATRDLPWKWQLKFESEQLGRTVTADHEQFRRTVWMCPREEWPSLEFFLDNVTVIDSKVGFFAKSIRYQVNVPDLFKMACGDHRGSVLQIIPMHIFTLHGPGWIVKPQPFEYEEMFWTAYNLEAIHAADGRSS